LSISVIVTCFNEEECIEQALLSVLNQNRLDLVEKIFVVDDESSDRSPEIIAAIAELDERIEVISQKNSGLAVARNNALKRVETEWVCFLDGDDIWPVDKIEKQMNEIKKDPEISLVYTDSYRFGIEERYIRARTLPQSGPEAIIDYFINDAPILSSLMIRMEVFQKFGFFDPELRVAQDTEMWSRAVARYKTKHVKEALLFRRIHVTSLGANFDQKAKYLDLVTDKIVNQFPELRPYRHLKDAMLRFEHARRCIRARDHANALKYAVSGLKLNPRSIHGYAVLMMAALPFSDKLLKSASKLRMNLRIRQAPKKIPVPHYDRKATLQKIQGAKT
jgi:glycosyltransferase involved in cell wall biosynthesis